MDGRRDADTESWKHFFEGVLAMLEREPTEGVHRPGDPKTAVEDFELGLPRHGRPLVEVVDHMLRLAEGSPSTASPRFFNQLFGGRTTAASMADMLSTLLNNTMHTYKAGGVQMAVERELSRRMAALSGFERGEGSFTPGGSLSNLLALIVARGERFPESDQDGLTGRRPVVYTSALGHYSVSKNVRLAGMGRGSLRKIATDARGRMKPDALAAQIREDRAQGLDPLFINATAGTTVLAAFDPIDALAEVAAAEGVWLHVDGALGGSMLLSEKTRPLLAGLERADSFTWDAHKAMGVPVTCSVCLVREPGVLARHLAETADYLFQEDEALDRGQTSMQCGRRNDALKLWAAWQALGDEGFADRIDQLVACAQRAAECIERAPTLRLVKAPESVNVVFEVDGVEPDALCKALYNHGRAMVGHAQVDGATVVRLACVNVSATPDDVDAFFADVERTAAELRSSSSPST